MKDYLQVLSTVESLAVALQGYFRDVADMWEQHGLNIVQLANGDHIGFQVLSAHDFDAAHEMLLEYSELTLDQVIHERRNRCYRFRKPLVVARMTFRGIEIFEPKPNSDINKLRPGIEHIAVLVKDYEQQKEMVQSHGLKISKEADYGAGKFFKTVPIGKIEVEFWNVPLVQ